MYYIYNQKLRNVTGFIWYFTVVFIHFYNTASLFSSLIYSTQWSAKMLKFHTIHTNSLNIIKAFLQCKELLHIKYCKAYRDVH